MSLRHIDTTISTIRGKFDINGNYISAGNYYYRVKAFRNGNFVGTIRDVNEYSDYVFSPRSLVKMMAVGQSRLARLANMRNIPGMPEYPIPNDNSRLETRRSSSNSRSISIFRTSGNLIIDPPSENSIVRRYNLRSRNRRSAVSIAPAPTPQPPLRNAESTTIVTSCTICLENINSAVEKVLICGHKFHKNCVNEWFSESNHTKCPLCRKEHSDTNSMNRDLSYSDHFIDALDNLRNDFQNERNRILSRRR